MPSFLVTNLHGAPEPLLFRTLDDRAGKGRLGFLGGGVPMTPYERSEFTAMLAEGRSRTIGTTRVLEIITDPVTDAERAEGFTMAVRDAVLEALDKACDEALLTKVLDADLPELFRALDAIAERLWWRRPTPREAARARPNTGAIAAELRAAGAQLRTLEPRP